MTIYYAREETLSPAEFVDVLNRSSLGQRRPVNDVERIKMMLAHANLIVTARDRDNDSLLIGVSRCLTDFSYCCYCSDLAVDSSYQRHGVGKALIAESREAAGEEAFFFLLSAPAAEGYYPRIGMTKLQNAFSFPRTEPNRKS